MNKIGRPPHLTEEYVRREYLDKGRSAYEIAEDCRTYPNKVFRLMRKCGIPRREKSEAQRKALQSGRHKHPTKGTKRDTSTKLKISEGMAVAWGKISDEERERRAGIARCQWEAMPEEKRKELQQAAALAVRQASIDGSRLEKRILAEFVKRGKHVLFHHEKLLGGQLYELDLFLPEEKVVVEIDGPTHFLPIWGEDKLKERIEADHRKTGLLLNAGYRVVRVKLLAKNVSQAKTRDVLYEVLGAINENEPFIEIEVQDGAVQKVR